MKGYYLTSNDGHSVYRYTGGSAPFDCHKQSEAILFATKKDARKALKEVFNKYWNGKPNHYVANHFRIREA